MMKLKKLYGLLFCRKKNNRHLTSLELWEVKDYDTEFWKEYLDFKFELMKAEEYAIPLP